MSIEAMKQALEALSYVMSHGVAVQQAKDILTAAIEQAEKQEGVCARCGGIVYDPVIQQRSWQGLTDEEIKAAWSQLWYDLGNGRFAASDDPSRHTTVMFAHAIEAKLREKNHD